MRVLIAILFLFLASFFSCSKEEGVVSQDSIKPVLWEKYVGDYMVYDTLGNYMYNINISHSQSIAPSGIQPNDSLTISNFADTFDLTFQFIPNYTNLTFSQEFLEIQIHDSLKDYNNKSWFVNGASFDTSTTVNENSLINDTMIMYFVMDNIKFYIPEAQPYFFCKCKHVAVKQ